MSYFENFPQVFYRFGNNETPVSFPQISVYADVIDQIKDDVTTYKEYTILDNMRPDQVSYELYETPDYYWTFFLLNDNIREQGWPLSQVQLLEQCQRDFSGTTLVTADDLTSDQLTSTGAVRDKIVEGVTVVGQTSGVTAIVDHRHLDLGQVIVKGTKAFIEGEFVYLQSDINVGFNATTVVTEYLSTHHWEDASGNYVDLVNPNTGIVDITGGALNTEITHYDRYIRNNNNLKQIKVLREGVAGSIVNSLITAINE
jgi:hypothetical protein